MLWLDWNDEFGLDLDTYPSSDVPRRAAHYDYRMVPQGISHLVLVVIGTVLTESQLDNPSFDSQSCSLHLEAKSQIRPYNGDHSKPISIPRRFQHYEQSVLLIIPNLTY